MKLLDIRNELGLSQQEVAYLCALHAHHVASLEDGLSGVFYSAEIAEQTRRRVLSVLQEFMQLPEDRRKYQLSFMKVPVLVKKKGLEDREAVHPSSAVSILHQRLLK